MNTYELLARGYLPKELPPPFTSESLATAVRANSQNLPTNFSCTPGNQGNVSSRPAVHNLVRVGILRRKLSIPNPINYFQLADVIDTNRQALLQHVTSSKLSLTTPHTTLGSQRAIDPVKGWGYLPIARSLVRQFTILSALEFCDVSFPYPTQSIISNWQHVIDTNRQALLQHVTSSKLSLTTPHTTLGSQRAIDPVKGWGYLPIARSLCRASARYVLQTDIDNFYPSIYTHVIPWALHTKPVAKQHQRDFGLIGNVLDLNIRNSQDQQTLGIHIGPDCSLVIAEIILSKVDVALMRAGLATGFRYLDDYEFGFATYAEAEQALANLQGELSVYELYLNPRKTFLFELPGAIERRWASELRRFRIRRGGSGQQSDLIGYFSRAYELSQSYPDESVLRFALGRMRRNVVEPPNWPLYESTLLHIAAVEPGTLSTVVDELYRYKQAGYQVSLSKVADALHQVIRQHGSVNHGSEVAWAIWGCLLFKIPLDDQTASRAAEMEDSVVAILALDAKAKGLISNNISLTLWGSMMTTQSLYEENWLLSYEANVKSWLPSPSVHDHVTADPNFNFLKQNSVHFYDAGLSLNYQPSGVSIAEGPSGDEQPAVEQAEEASG